MSIQYSQYESKLNEIAERVAMSPADVETCLYESVPFTKHLTFQRDGVYQKLYNALTLKGEGIFYCIVTRANTSHYEITAIDDYVGQMFKAISQHVSKYGYKVIYRCNNHLLADETYYENILNKYPDAGLISLVPYQFEQLVQVCNRFNRPVLVMDHFDRNSPYDFHMLGLDNYMASQQMTDYLIQKGHRRIAYLAGRMENNHSAQERFRGYRSALENAGIPYNPDWVKYGDWEQTKAEQLVTELLQGDERPGAIVCANDLSAMGAYIAIYNAGLRIPEDISVTGFDDIPMAMNCNPPLTTVRQPIKEIGKLAGESMVQMLEGKTIDRFQLFQNLQIIERESVADLSG